MNLADEVDGVAGGIGRDADGDNGSRSIVDGGRRAANLRLLPPEESEGVAVRVARPRSIETDGSAGLGRRGVGRRPPRFFVANQLRVLLHDHFPAVDDDDALIIVGDNAAT